MNNETGDQVNKSKDTEDQSVGFLSRHSLGATTFALVAGVSAIGGVAHAMENTVVNEISTGHSADVSPSPSTIVDKAQAKETVPQSPTTTAPNTEYTIIPTTPTTTVPVAVSKNPNVGAATIVPTSEDIGIEMNQFINYKVGDGTQRASVPITIRQGTAALSIPGTIDEGAVALTQSQSGTVNEAFYVSNTSGNADGTAGANYLGWYNNASPSEMSFIPLSNPTSITGIMVEGPNGSESLAQAITNNDLQPVQTTIDNVNVQNGQPSDAEGNPLGLFVADS